MSDDDDFWGAGEEPSGPPDDVEVRVSVAGLGAGDTRLFGFVRDASEHTGVVVRHGDGFSVFVNRCPHVPYPLDLGDGRVLTKDRRRLICSSHGAEFDRHSGRCVAGPVVGRALERLSFTHEGDALIVAIPPEPEGWPRTYF